MGEEGLMNKYQIENPFIKLTLTDFGARVVELVIKPLNRNVVLGYKDLFDYLDDPNYFGATIGPNANRIKDGRFTLEGKEFEWDINNGPNNNHSGKYGLDKAIWDLSKKDENSIEFTIKRAQPFKYEASVNYSLSEDGLDIKIRAQGEETSLFNFTNHSYFNLDGWSAETMNDISNHNVQLYSNKVTLSDENLIPTGQIHETKEGTYDFTSPKSLWEMLSKNKDFLAITKGYDNNYLMDEPVFQKFAKINVKDLVLGVYSDAPGFQFYTGNFIKINGEDKPYLGLCIEPQDVPNSINSTEFEKPVYEKGEIFERNISYRFEL